ncbi:MAG: hypothetical protein IT449_00400 [Phycisphaerales bacterium]|nr:hypothetical protein [Phycisphaerales bacterium]
MNKQWIASLRRKAVLLAGSAMLYQAAGCQTTGQELVGGLVSAAITNVINSFVFDAFGLP